MPVQAVFITRGTSDSQMPILILLLVAMIAGSVVYLVGSRFPTPVVGQAPAQAAGRKLGQEAVRHPWLSRTLRSRLDPATATGLALTVALAAAITGGLVLGLLAYLMRTNAQLVEIDNSVGQWEVDHATHLSTQALQRVTDLAGAGPGAAELQPGRSDARPVVPQRPFGDGGRSLCGGGARAGASSSTAHTCPHRGGGGGGRGGSRVQPRDARSPLALGRHCGPRFRMGVVRDLRDCVRRPFPLLRRAVEDRNQHRRVRRENVWLVHGSPAVTTAAIPAQGGH